jgi:hypothetical protein
MNKAQAEEVLKTLNERMQSCRLELHPEKTKLNKAYDWLKRVKDVSRNYKCTENGKLECTENGNNCAQLFCFQK